MEGKRAAAFCCLLLVLLSGQLQQGSASIKSRFCDCYKSCYPDCRNHLPRWLCVLKCMDDCSPTMERVVRPTSAGDCDNICRPLRLCGGLMSTGTDDADIVESCLDDCNSQGPGAHAPTAANLD
ncbi:hypothetical protein QOZ80_2AG0113510 [Eleusine coracana subsp. coracana]|nr:hypothetical protein QOZ80_2AG0113510 [Eleusine coracana subsp. coracana]